MCFFFAGKQHVLAQLNSIVTGRNMHTIRRKILKTSSHNTASCHTFCYCKQAALILAFQKLISETPGTSKIRKSVRHLASKVPLLSLVSQLPHDLEGTQRSECLSPCGIQQAKESVIKRY